MEVEKKRETNFEVGDRVKTWYHDRWWSGTVVEIRPKRMSIPRAIFDTVFGKLGINVIKEDEKEVVYESPSQREMIIRTDERLNDDSGDLLGGFGLRGSLRGPFTILEGKPEPNTKDPIFWNR